MYIYIVCFSFYSLLMFWIIGPETGLVTATIRSTIYHGKKNQWTIKCRCVLELIVANQEEEHYIAANISGTK